MEKIKDLVSKIFEVIIEIFIAALLFAIVGVFSYAMVISDFSIMEITVLMMMQQW